MKLLRERGKNIPKDKDLDLAFTLADVDESGSVDESEFLGLLSLIDKGEITGLSKSGFFGSGKAKKKRAAFQEKFASTKSSSSLESSVTVDVAADEDEDNSK